MILSKTQIEIMKIFASKITQTFSIRQIAGMLKKPYSLIHRSIKALVTAKLVSKNEHGLISLNYKENYSVVSYIESLRSEMFLEINKTIGLFTKDVLSRIEKDFFILLVFGSYAAGKEKPKDLDILLIAPNEEDVTETEKIIDRVSSGFTTEIHPVVISAKSAYGMLAERNKPNVFNETLDNHIILFGAENYYRLLKNAR